MRRYRLYKITSARKIISELLLTDNLGRATTLLMKLPNVEAYGRDCHDSYYGSGARINLWLIGGYEYTFTGYQLLIYYVKEAGKFAYMKWIKEYIKLTAPRHK